MSNVFKTPDVIAAEALMHLEDSLVIAAMASKDVTSEFSKTANGYAVGQSINFKTRPSFIAKEFTTTIDKQDVREITRPMTIEKHFDVSVGLSAIELAMDLDNFSDQIIKPAAYALAEKVDAYVGTKILDGRGLYASATVLGTAGDMALARSAANYQQLNPAGRFGIVDSALEARLLGYEYFNRTNYRGADGEIALRTGNMGVVMNFDWNASLNMPAASIVQTAGTAAAANAGGTKNLIGDTTLVVDSLLVGVTAGNYIKVAGLRRPLKVLTTTAALATEIPLVDPIDEIIIDTAAVTMVNSGKTVTVLGALFDDNSLGIAMPVLDLPEDKVASVLASNGISIRVVKGYDMDTKKTTMSLDLLCAAIAVDPRRITLIGDAA